MDGLELLIQDHRTVDQVFDQYQQTSDDAERRRLVDTMIEELSIHAAIEERELYPLMHRSLPEDDSVEHAEHEHAEAKAVLAVLGQLEPTDEPFDEMVNELISDVRHHVQEEEDELFPQLREAVSDEELEQLGQRLEQAKQSAPKKPSAAELEALSGEELQQFAQKMGVEGRSDLNKQQLAKALVGE